MEEKIREIVAAHGKLAVAADSFGSADDLFTLGFTSHASVNVMLALEDAFDVEFPDETLKKATFTSIDSMAAVVRKLVAEAA